MKSSEQKHDGSDGLDHAEIERLWGEGGRLTSSGVDTPGCDCGMNGWGRSWHKRECSWGKATRHPDHPNLATWERRLMAGESE